MEQVRVAVQALAQDERQHRWQRADETLGLRKRLEPSLDILAVPADSARPRASQSDGGWKATGSYAPP